MKPLFVWFLAPDKCWPVLWAGVTSFYYVESNFLAPPTHRLLTKLRGLSFGVLMPLVHGPSCCPPLPGICERLVSKSCDPLHPLLGTFAWGLLQLPGLRHIQVSIGPLSVTLWVMFTFFFHVQGPQVPHILPCDQRPVGRPHHVDLRRTITSGWGADAVFRVRTSPQGSP